MIAALFVAGWSRTASAQTVPPLGAAQSFAVLGGTAITATGSAVISGNVGVSPGSAVTGFPPAIVQNGQIYSGVGSLAGPAKTSARTAYDNLKGQACPPANDLTGKILGQTPGFLSLNPGVYCFDTSAQLNATLTLNDGGDPNAIFIFQIGTTLTTASSSQVIMSGGGRGTNVYWQVGTSATIGTSTVFRGHIIADTSVTLTTSASTTGRVFALDGAATIDSTQVAALPTTIQFSAANYNANEGCDAALITVTRTGDTSGVATVDYLTGDGSGLQRTDYTLAAGRVTFNAGVLSKTFILLGTKDAYNNEGMEAFNLTLSNPIGAALGGQSTATSSIADDGSVLANSQPIDDAGTFVCQHYHDFLARTGDAGGAAFWTDQITQCGNDQNCINARRVGVSNAFFYEQEFQQTGSYVYRLYRAAYGDNQPSPNSDPNLTEARKMPRYVTFMRDRAQVVGGSELANTQQSLANAFVLRPEFVAKYPAALSTGTQFVNAVLLTIQNATGADLSSQSAALITHFNNGGRGLVMFHLGNDYWNGCNRLPGSPATPCVPAGFGAAIDNRPFIDAEYNRAFVYTQYAGYLRRDAEIDGFLFWLGQVESAPLRSTTKQNAMVCSFITSTEYQQRFSSIVTHSNAECAP
jgi:hypothetical protein